LKKVQGADASGSGRVCVVKVLDGSLGICQVVDWFPCIVFFSVALPLNEVLELASVNSGVEDLLYFMFEVSINLHRGWLGFGLAGDSWFLFQAQPGYINHRVNLD
jgi:hypothetical protein